MSDVVPRGSLEEQEFVCERAFDDEHPPLRRDPAVRGEATDLSVGCDYAVTGHDDRERVAAERLPHCLRSARQPEPDGDVAVGDRLAGRDCPGGVVDATVEVRHVFHSSPPGWTETDLAVGQGGALVVGSGEISTGHLPVELGGL